MNVQVMTAKKAKLSPRMEIYLNTLECGMLTITLQIKERINSTIGQELLTQLPKITSVRLVNELRDGVIDTLEKKISSYPEESKIWQDIENLSKRRGNNLVEDLSIADQAKIELSTAEANWVVNTIFNNFIKQFFTATANSEQSVNGFVKDYLTQYGIK